MNTETNFPTQNRRAVPAPTRGEILFFCLSMLTAWGVWFCALWTVRHLGDVLRAPCLTDILGADTQGLLAGIFSGLSDARVEPGIFVLLCVWAVFALLFCSHNRVRRRAVLGLLPLFLLIGYILSVVCADVNGVRFYDILFSLAKMAGNGLFEVL